MWTRASELASALRDYGLAGVPELRLRQARSINVVALVSAAASVLYTLFYFVLGPIDFAALYLYNGAGAICYLAIIAVNSRAGAHAAMWCCIVIAFVHLIGASILLGTAAGAHFYLLAIPLVVALVVADDDRVTIWPVSAAALLAFAALHNLRLAGRIDDMPALLQQLLQTANGAGLVVLAMIIAFYFRAVVRQSEAGLRRANQRSDNLLRAIFPGAIAERLKQAPDNVIAERHAGVTVLFADIVAFTKRAADLPPERLVGDLDQVFSKCDELAERHGIEKIKTIGDAYFAVAGLSPDDTGHTLRMAAFALELRELAALLDDDIWPDLKFRTAIHVGPVVAGVIGKSKYAYDAWGETVNIAARLVELCEPDEIIVSSDAKAALPGDTGLGPPRHLDVRDVGRLQVFPLLS